jgi:Domain of unknown function (DUF4391)
MMSTFEDGMKQMVDLIERIKWSNKLSRETINLEGKEIQEIQIFEIELRKQDDITGLLQVVDKAISYPIIIQRQRVFSCLSKA